MSQQNPEQSGGKVLIVDDNIQNVELLQAYLEDLPVKTFVAVDGIDAMDKVHAHQPDIILLDIMMPKMSGFEVCKNLKKDPVTRDIPIIMITALNEISDIERSVECGTDDFLTKPVNKLELLTRVKSLLRLRHLKNELERALAYMADLEAKPPQVQEEIMKPEIRKPTQEEKDKAQSWPIWQKEASEFPWKYDEKETCLILDGEVTVVTESEGSYNFGQGDWVIFPQGLKCTWQIKKDVRKHYKFG